MDNQLKDIFFQLLRIGLWGEGTLSLDQPMTTDDWNRIYRYATNHTIEGLIYDSFSFLEEHQLPPQSLRLKWAVRVDQIERHNAKMNNVIAEQFTAFSSHGIRPILQKGQGVASYYRIPNHRISGDIDFCFEDDGYAKARSFLKENQLKFQDTAGFSLDYNFKGIHIEHHKKTFDFRSPLKRSYLKKLLEVYKEKQQTVSINDISVRLLAPELQLLQVNIHILKHLITYGIGLRQFCDSARLYYLVSAQINNEALQKIYEKTGVMKWTHLLHKILVENLGLPTSKLPFPYPENLETDWMLDEVWYSGNFGFKDERFENSKKSTRFARPDSPKRLWQNFKRYVKYAPQEAIAFPLIHTYSKFLGRDSD
ncbi:nucleotidyltransferase domain-containing protein [Sphingobacterium detergens]|uniref:Putative nucleotidyltransferase-like protein n=1 Tax=Sphingobacterium detergens TaxID=1145106 RepID=A0A420ALQ4_SPHD1|nr:nucleotidyltransferase family protein [Sphingobacterium detergens]RKE45373.1 putative nucleotidyltransferase-like protein [Sphingobacterium detergens]